MNPNCGATLLFSESNSATCSQAGNNGVCNAATKVGDFDTDDGDNNVGEFVVSNSNCGQLAYGG